MATNIQTPVHTMERPMLFIGCDDSGKLTLNKEAAKFLDAVDNPITVVGIVGKYRTGKSYLLNLLFGQSDGFELGSTIQSKTKGIWIWCRPHPVYPERVLVLLDTEGLSDVEKGNEDHDNQIFVLATLLTSCLVYNSKGTIDNDAIQSLHFITTLTEHLKIKATPDEETGDEFDAFFPHFIWVVRDFTLELIIDGKQCSANEYLENALQLKTGRSKAVRDYNLPRDCLRNFFRWRRCFTICKPVEDDKLLNHLEKVPDDQLKPAFKEQMKAFNELVLKEAKVMKIRDVAVTGKRFLILADSYITAINDGTIPCVDNAVEAMGRRECERAIQHAHEHYMKLVTQAVDQKLPLTSDEISIIHGEAETSALKEYSKIAMFESTGEFQEKLQVEILSAYKALQEENFSASTHKCKTLLTQLSADVQRKIANGEYTGAHCYQKYKEDTEKVVDQYKAEEQKGPAAESILAEFLEAKKTEGGLILAADKAMSEKDKEMAAVEEERKRLEQEKLAAEEKVKQMHREMEDFEKSMQANMKQLREDMAEHLQETIKSNEELMKKRQEEQQKMLEKGLKTQADMMEQSVKELREERQELEEKYKQDITEMEEAMKKRDKQLEELATAAQAPKEKESSWAQAGAFFGELLAGYQQSRSLDQSTKQSSDASGTPSGMNTPQPTVGHSSYPIPTTKTSTSGSSNLKSGQNMGATTSTSRPQMQSSGAFPGGSQASAPFRSRQTSSSSSPFGTRQQSPSYGAERLFGGSLPNRGFGSTGQGASRMPFTFSSGGRHNIGQFMSGSSQLGGWRMPHSGN